MEEGQAALDESIQCCVFWKETYIHASRVHSKYSAHGWVLDETSIFAHVDAFIQRCKDLQEVVIGQVSRNGSLMCGDWAEVPNGLKEALIN